MSPGQHRPLVALISANPVVIAPAKTAFEEEFPEARLWNILDDRLQDDADHRGVTGSLAQRLHRLIEHAVLEGAEAILLTCPVYTTALRSYTDRCPVPLLDPDETALQNVFNAAPGTVLVLASARQPLTVAVNRLINETAERGVPIEIRGAVVKDAQAPAVNGDTDGLSKALLTAVQKQPVAPEAILLAQYSLGPATNVLEAATGIPVYSGPLNSAAALRRTIFGGPQ
ncbi:hypothetical protein [Arthrobacter sp. ZGTC412]|uniref:hypothetical protein n=1 Tax=Arthrobacter sp. ZGTC412 TaxID=2058900 RepID=UPI0011B066C4|nr:hypothetical protein [Arthrobacter sp. ZGTC412]